LVVTTHKDKGWKCFGLGTIGMLACSREDFPDFPAPGKMS
jgi:hypothetical protein